MIKGEIGITGFFKAIKLTDESKLEERKKKDKEKFFRSKE